jgi:hypothetical protein
MKGQKRSELPRHSLIFISALVPYLFSLPELLKLPILASQNATV